MIFLISLIEAKCKSILLTDLNSRYSTALLFFLIKKVTKKSRQQNAPFAARGLYPANQPEPQGGTFGPCFAPTHPALQPEANALPTTLATMFCLISSGSGLLSKKEGDLYSYLKIR